MSASTEGLLKTLVIFLDLFLTFLCKMCSSSVLRCAVQVYAGMPDNIRHTQEDTHLSIHNATSKLVTTIRNHV